MSQIAETWQKARELNAESDLPVVVPVASGRSPRRRARKRVANRAWLAARARKTFLTVFQATGDARKAQKFIHYGPSTISRWKKEYPQFAEQYEEIQGLWEWIIDDHLRSLSIKAVDAIEMALTQTENKRLAFEAAKLILKRSGHLSDKVQHSGPHGGPVRFVAILPDEPGSPR